MKEERKALLSLLAEITHNKVLVKRELEGKAPSWLKTPYHTVNYSTANSEGALGVLPREVCEAIFDAYDIIFAFHHGKITSVKAEEEAREELRLKLMDAEERLKTFLEI